MIKGNWEKERTHVVGEKQKKNVSVHEERVHDIS